MLDSQESLKSDEIGWEQKIRQAFKKSQYSQDPTEQELANSVLELPELNNFCFIIGPKIAEHLVENDKRKLEYRL